MLTPEMYETVIHKLYCLTVMIHVFQSAFVGEVNKMLPLTSKYAHNYEAVPLIPVDKD